MAAFAAASAASAAASAALASASALSLFFLLSHGFRTGASASATSLAFFAASFRAFSAVSAAFCASVRGVHLNTLSLTTSNLTEYSDATCAIACAKPSNVITLGAALLPPARCLHLAKMTAAVPSVTLAPISPHARTVASNDSGRIPCLLPPNASKLASILRLSSPMSSTTPGALYVLLDWSAASFLAHAANGAGETSGMDRSEPPPVFAAVFVAFASGVPSDAATAAVTADCAASSATHRSKPRSAYACSASTGASACAPPCCARYWPNMDLSAPGDVASGPGICPLADSAATRAALAAARSSAPEAAPAELTALVACGAHWEMRDATCPNVTRCSAAMCAHAWRKVPSSHRSVRELRPVALAKMMSHEALLTDPPMRPQSLTSLAQSRPVTASAPSPALPPEPYPANASKDLRRARAAADSAKPAGTSGAGR